MRRTTDTIVAISTPLGMGALGIVRMSGPSAIAVARKIFKPKRKKKITSMDNFSISYGLIKKNGDIIDEALLSIMRAPATYTREDVVEISVHGSLCSLKSILDACIKEGARLAEPGEFTKKAYLNGRIDLVQAESVCDMVEAKTEGARKLAINQMVGYLSDKIRESKKVLIDAVSEIEAGIEFPEEDIMTPGKKALNRKICRIKKDIEDILATYESGRLFKEGINIVIAGKPNVGKSSLMNSLLKEERVIVSDVPGTTRDIISEEIDMKGIRVRLTDTAGIRKRGGKIEILGLDRCRHEITNADIILFVIDLSEGFTKEDMYVLEGIKEKDFLIIGNKYDIGKDIKIDLGKICNYGKRRFIKVSALYGTGIKDLERAVYRVVINRNIISSNRILLSNIRHKNTLEKCLENVTKAEKGLARSISEEFISYDLRQAIDNIGEITGETTSEDILDNIFSRFCIGK